MFEQKTTNMNMSLIERLPHDWESQFKDYLLREEVDFDLAKEHRKYVNRFGRSMDENSSWVKDIFFTDWYKRLTQRIKETNDLKCSEVCSENIWQEALYGIAQSFFEEIVDEMDMIKNVHVVQKEKNVKATVDGVVEMLSNLQTGAHECFNICHFGHRTTFYKGVPISDFEWVLQCQWGKGKAKHLIQQALQQGKIGKKNKTYHVL